MTRAEVLWAEQITVREAYLAMQEFLVTYWKVGGEMEEDVRFLIDHISGDPREAQIDPALEDDWLDAIEKTRGQ